MTAQTKTLAALIPGDHLYLPLRDAYDIYEVRHVHTWYASDGRLDATVTAVSLATDAAEVLHGRAHQELTLATAEQVTAALELGVRNRAAAQLREIAALIELNEIRIVEHWGTPDVRLIVAEGEIERVARIIGVDTTEYGSQRRAVWPGPDRSVVVSAEFVGMPAPAPVDAPEVVPAEPGGDADQVATEALASGDPGDDLWFFVFGPNSEHYGRYLCLHGSEESTRWRVAEVFGEGATDQYARVDARVDHLLVMPEVEWPTVARPGE